MTTEDNGIRIKRVRREEPVPTSSGVAETRAPEPVRGVGLPARLGRDARETKPFYLTSEFLLALLTIAALIIAGYAGDDELNTWRTWLLVATVASAYILSRGIAKAGSHDRH